MVGGHKVLQARALYIDPGGRTRQLFEILVTGRDYMATLLPLQFVEQQLSRIAAEGPGGAGCAIASRKLLPAFCMTDKDMATLNALSKCFNGVK